MVSGVKPVATNVTPAGEDGGMTSVATEEERDSWHPQELVDESLRLLQACIAQFDTNGEARPGQVEMTRQIATAIALGSRVSLKAGTGTGKSLGYLVPAVASGKRVIVVVSSIALQDQLRTKDLPFVEAVHGPFDWAVVKGRGRYLCRAKAGEAEAELSKADQSALFDAGQAPEALDDQTAEQVRTALDWMRTTTTGDLSELPFELEEKPRRLLVSSNDECPGKERCAQGGECFSEAARSSARSAKIAVVNASLFGMDISVDGSLLGPADCVIIDEAHEAEDAFASALSSSLSLRQLRSLASVASRFLTKEGKDEGLGSAPARLRRSVKALRAIADDDSALAKVLGAHAGKRLPKGGLAALPDLEPPMTEAARAVLGMARALDGMEKFVSAAGAKARIGRAQKFAMNVCGALDDLTEDPEHDAMWVEESGDAIVRCPVQIGSLLHNRAWRDRAVVLTSATLPPEYPVRLGFYPSDPYVDVGSPFDHREQSLIYVPYLPDLKSPEWEPAAWAEMKMMILAAEGRTLALFTSYKNMHAFVARARADLPYDILVQGEAPKPALIERFRQDEHSCLFATSSFFTGLDIQGSTCSLVIIDRIPFPRPDDPLWQARREVAGDQWVSYRDPSGTPFSLRKSFATVDVPRAATLLAQAAGRLVRSSRCRGVIMVTDPRLAGDPDNPRRMAYRHLLLAEMPPARRKRTSRDAILFLAAAVGRDVPAA